MTRKLGEGIDSPENPFFCAESRRFVTIIRQSLRVSLGAIQF